MIPQNEMAEVAALERFDLEALRTVWRKRYGLPPALRSEDLLRVAPACRQTTSGAFSP